MSVVINFISGHFFGICALKGILESVEYSKGQLDISLLLSLDIAKESVTVGFQDFSDIAAHYKIPHKIILSVKHEEVIELIRKKSPDFILAIGLSELVPSTILDIPKSANNSSHRHSATHGCIGMHPTLLPQGRGRAPIPWAIIKGLKETGVTAFLLEEEADSGNIVLQESIQISPKETASSLFVKCSTAHETLGKKLAPALADMSLTWIEQDASKVTVWPKRKPEDGLINFSESIYVIDRLIRALTEPYPGAFFYYEGQKFVVNEVNLLPQSHSEQVGTIIAVSSQWLPTIAAQDGVIECLSIKDQSGRATFKIGDNVATLTL